MDEPELLAQPIAPLSELLPDVAHRPEAQVELTEPLVLRLPAILRQALEERASIADIPFPVWLTDRLEELANGTARWSGAPRRVDDRYRDEYGAGVPEDWAGEWADQAW